MWHGWSAGRAKRRGQGADYRRRQQTRGAVLCGGAGTGGSQEFAEKLHGLLDGKQGAVNRMYRAAAQHQAHGEAQARALLRAGLREAGLTAQELDRLPGNDERKVKIALRLWDGTTAAQGWIAEKLGMKSAANVSQILRRVKKDQKLSGYVD